MRMRFGRSVGRCVILMLKKPRLTIESKGPFIDYIPSVQSTDEVVNVYYQPAEVWMVCIKSEVAAVA